MPTDESFYRGPGIGSVIDTAAVATTTMAVPAPAFTGHTQIATTAPGLGTNPVDPDCSAGTRRLATSLGNRVGSTITVSRRPRSLGVRPVDDLHRHLHRCVARFRYLTFRAGGGSATAVALSGGVATAATHSAPASTSSLPARPAMRASSPPRSPR